MNVTTAISNKGNDLVRPITIWHVFLSFWTSKNNITTLSIQMNFFGDNIREEDEQNQKFLSQND